MPSTRAPEGNRTLESACEAGLWQVSQSRTPPEGIVPSMLPAGLPGSDAWANLDGALRLFDHPLQPGVQVYFNGKLLHGARASKLRSDAFDAFAVQPRQRNAARAETLPAALSYCQPRQPVNLAVLPVFPGLQAAHLRGLLDSGVQGLVLECYGSGTGPSDDEALLDVLHAARQRGVVLVAISQCPQGSVLFDTYAAGSRLRDAGLVSAGGMTREAVLGKLFALLGAGLDAATTEHWLALDLCGEAMP